MTQKAPYRVGSTDPTHWRQDELETARQDKSTNPQKKRWLILGFILILIFVIYNYRGDIALLLPQPGQKQPQFIYQAPPEKTEPLPQIQPSKQKNIVINLEAEQRHAENEKEAAWSVYFKPSAWCQEHATVECANTYIRERRQFEANYKRQQGN